MTHIPTEHPGRTHSGGAAHWLIWTALFLLFAYPLSPGPLAKIIGPAPPPAFRVIYAPLGYLCDHVKPVESFYKWYGDVWDVSL